MDPDILVVSPFEELHACFNRGANCVLTPHILEPAEYAEMEDRKFLIYGIYNLGFCALRDTEQVSRIVSWWSRRLETHCVIDLQNGLFVDQKWADLLPAYIDNTAILHHPGYNIAYWNLSQRRVRLSDGKWTVNGQPVRFFHFSGNKIEDDQVFSRHTSQFNINNIGDVAGLLDIYRSCVYRHGHRYFSTLPYAFSWDGVKGQNEHTPRSICAGGTKRRFGAAAAAAPARTIAARVHGCARAALDGVISKRRQIETDAIRRRGHLRAARHMLLLRQKSLVPGWREACAAHPAGWAGCPNWREDLRCLSCGLVNPARAALHILRQEFAPARDTAIHITERSTPAFAWLKAHFPNAEGTEFFCGERKSGDRIDGVPDQDVRILS